MPTCRSRGAARDAISIFRYPGVPRAAEAPFPQGRETALDRNIGFIVNRMNERVIAGASIETLRAVLMFVMMGITLERGEIVDDLLTRIARVFGLLPGGLAVSVVIVGAFPAASTGIVGATVVTMGPLALPTMLRNNDSPERATGVIAASRARRARSSRPPSRSCCSARLRATSTPPRGRTAPGWSNARTRRPISARPASSVGTLFRAAPLPGIVLAFLNGAYAFGYARLNPARAPALVMAGGPPPARATPAPVVMLPLGIDVDLRTGIATMTAADWIAPVIVQLACQRAFPGLLCACWVLLRAPVPGTILRETAKATSMAFTIPIGSLRLSLVLISFGGEH